MALPDDAYTHGGGRPKGSRNLATLIREHLRPDAPQRAAAIIDTVLDSQKMEGVRALRQLSPRPTGETIEIDLPEIKRAADILVAQNRVMQATARGEIATERAQELMRMLDSQRETVVAVELEAEVAELREIADEFVKLKKAVEEATKQ
jgi:hypothetical protein